MKMDTAQASLVATPYSDEESSGQDGFFGPILFSPRYREATASLPYDEERYGMPASKPPRKFTCT